ncbi:MAG TPA: PIN domain-containing protein [Thermoanaerobaculia bacterium]|nr:PIN domain-containing protein [Thermoanaerobaculia bacterium]
MEWFADTWFFIALLDRRDPHHRRAVSILSRLRDAEKLVTHDAVLTELLAHFSDDGETAREAAVAYVRTTIRQSQVVPSNRELFLVGLDRYAERRDKQYSLVDCMSMVLMEQRDIRHVLTNDHHFTQAGFTIVNE